MDLERFRVEDAYQPMRWIMEFHKKHNFAIASDLQSMGNRNPQVTTALLMAADLLSSISTFMEHQFAQDNDMRNDVRFVRAHLMIEELGETLLGLAKNDILHTADGLGDLLYVTYGSGVSFGLPLEQVLREVQRSNMTKAVRRKEDTRLRDKGPDFTPPDLKTILDNYGFYQRETKETQCDTQA